VVEKEEGRKAGEGESGRESERGGSGKGMWRRGQKGSMRGGGGSERGLVWL